MTRGRTFLAILALTLASVPVLVARASGGATAAKRATTVRLSANPSGKLRFNRTRLSARAGRVTVVMSNPRSSGLPHAIAVEGHGVDKDGATVAAGGTSRVTVTLRPGRYAFYCPVDGHRAAGMKGTLVVR